VPEPAGGAHRNPRRAAEAVERAVVHALGELRRVPAAALVRRRYDRYRSLGGHVEAPTSARRARVAPRIAKPRAVR
jgi:acetyl-CoA carboxylase carboxyl transferase subunit alpha